MGIRVPRILELASGRGTRRRSPGRQVEDFLRMTSSAGRSNVVVLLAGPREAVSVAEHLRHSSSAASGWPSGPTWLVGSLGLDLLRVEASWRGVFGGGVFVQPHAPELR